MGKLTRSMFLEELAQLLARYDAEIFATDFGTLRADIGTSKDQMPDERRGDIFFEVDFSQSCVDSKKARILAIKYEEE